MRLFIALPLTDEIEQRLDSIIADLRKADGDRAVKWVGAGNIHLTLKFLGETREDLIPPIKSVINEAVREYGAIRMHIDQLGGFPNLNRPRVIFIRGSNPLKSLGNLAVRLDEALAGLGFTGEQRSFKAHLTLGRVRQGARIGSLAGDLERYHLQPFEALLDRITLFKSTLTPKGPIYERLHETILGEERFGE